MSQEIIVVGTGTDADGVYINTDTVNSQPFFLKGSDHCFVYLLGSTTRFPDNEWCLLDVGGVATVDGTLGDDYFDNILFRQNPINTDPNTPGDPNDNGIPAYSGYNALAGMNANYSGGAVSIIEISALPGESGASNTVYAEPGYTPDAPSGLIAAPASEQVVLTWTPPAEYAKINIYMKGPSDSAFTLIATVENPTATYTKTGLTNFSNYAFYVTATSQ